MNVIELCAEMLSMGLYRAGYTPQDAKFWTQPAKWVGSTLFEPTPDEIADYRQWRSENLRAGDSLIAAVAEMGYKLSVSKGSVGRPLTGQAYAAYRGMPDAGRALRVEGVSASEVLLRVSYVVALVTRFNVALVAARGEDVPAYDPWA